MKRWNSSRFVGRVRTTPIKPPNKGPRRSRRVWFFSGVFIWFAFWATVVLWYGQIAQQPNFTYSRITATTEQFEFLTWRPEDTQIPLTGYVALSGFGREAGVSGTNDCLYGYLKPNKNVRLIFAGGEDGPTLTLEPKSGRADDPDFSVGEFVRISADEEEQGTVALGRSAEVHFWWQCLNELRQATDPNGAGYDVPSIEDFTRSPGTWRFLVLGEGSIGADLNNAPGGGASPGLLEAEVQFFGRAVDFLANPLNPEPGYLYSILPEEVRLPAGVTLSPLTEAAWAEGSNGDVIESAVDNPSGLGGALMIGFAQWNGRAYEISVSTESRKIEVSQPVTQSRDLLSVGTIDRFARDPFMQSLITLIGALTAYLLAMLSANLDLFGRRR